MKKRLSRRALVLWTGLAVIVAGLVAGGLTISHGFSARDNPTLIETIVAQAAREMAVPRKAKGMKNPYPDSPEALADARAHWADHCATCHANNGSGKTEIGQNLYPKVPDMRLEETQSQSDGELYYTIQNGIRLTGMPAWGEISDHDEASWKLVQFIRHLPKLTAEEEKQMEQLNPKGPGERQEEQEEQQFLEGVDPSPMPNQPHLMKSHSHLMKPEGKK